MFEEKLVGKVGTSRKLVSQMETYEEKLNFYPMQLPPLLKPLTLTPLGQSSKKILLSH